MQKYMNLLLFLYDIIYLYIIRFVSRQYGEKRRPTCISKLGKFAKSMFLGLYDIINKVYLF